MAEKVRQSHRVLRVFVSSTFRDMQDERDELVKRVFPALRELCESRGVVWGEVDLRWGITSEQAAEGQVLPICLAEIRDCRPYFLGLLGERYGWVPEYVDPALIEQEPWLADHFGRSVTELEIIEGVLGNPDMAEHAYFYFRDPVYSSRNEAFTETVDPLEVEHLGSEKALERAEARRARLVALKDQIRSSGFAVKENFLDPRSLGDLVLADLTDLVDRLFPAGSEPSPTERERGLHDVFARRRATVYIARPECFERLADFVSGTGLPLVVVGESGVGKSALLASWALRWRERHAQAVFADDSAAVFVVMHFVAASPASADWAGMLRRIMAELNDHFELGLEIPDEAEALRRAFADSLSRAAAKGKVVLAIDALNQLDDKDGAVDLIWLPPVIPDNVRLVLSTLPGPAQDELTRRGWPTLQVEPLRVAERQKLISSYLYDEYRKTLAPEFSERVANAPQSANPLFLRTMLEELRLFGEHETLQERLNTLLSATDVPALYELVLQRFESDYERDRTGLVQEAMTLIWAARYGLAEAELLQVLGAGENPLPHGIWSPLYLASKSMLVNHDGLLGFAHDYAHVAIEKRYLPDDAAKAGVRLRLADYFALGRQLASRKLQEVPWQLGQARAWPKLSRLLAQPWCVTALWDMAPYDLRNYWVQIETNSTLRMVDAYASLEDAPRDTDLAVLDAVASLLADMGHLTQALRLRQRVTQRARESGDLDKLRYSLGHQAAILIKRGDLDGALALLTEEEGICRELGNRSGMSGNLNGQAQILTMRGDLDVAMELLTEQEGICREFSDANGLSSALGCQAVIRDKQGHLDSAVALYHEEERICRALGNRDGLQASLGNQGLILKKQADLDGAMARYKEQEQICREIGNRFELQISLGNQGLTLYSRGDLDGAMALFNEQDRICRELGNPDGLQTSLGNQAAVRYTRGDLDAALALYREQTRICRELGNPDDLERSLRNQGVILDESGDLEGAMRLRAEQEQVSRELGKLDELQLSLANQAAARYARGDLDAAMALMKEQGRICRELGNRDGLQISLGNQAVILYERGDLNGALTLHTEQEELCRELESPDALLECLAAQAAILNQLGDLNRAMARYKEQERICRELDNREGLVSALAKQAAMLSDQAGAWYAGGGIGEALWLHQQQEEIYRELGDRQGLLRCLTNQAVILKACDQPDEALAVYKEQERICREIGDQDGLQDALHGQGLIFKGRGDLDGALALYTESERICRELGNREGLQRNLGNRSLILYERDDLDGAMALMQEQERICRETGNQSGLKNSLDNQAFVLQARREASPPPKQE
jgi:nephrocystin-3